MTEAPVHQLSNEIPQFPHIPEGFLLEITNTTTTEEPSSVSQEPTPPKWVTYTWWNETAQEYESRNATLPDFSVGIAFNETVNQWYEVNTKEYFPSEPKITFHHTPPKNRTRAKRKKKSKKNTSDSNLAEPPSDTPAEDTPPDPETPAPVASAPEPTVVQDTLPATSSGNETANDMGSTASRDTINANANTPELTVDKSTGWRLLEIHMPTAGVSIAMLVLTIFAIIIICTCGMRIYRKLQARRTHNRIRRLAKAQKERELVELLERAKHPPDNSRALEYSNL